MGEDTRIYTSFEEEKKRYHQEVLELQGAHFRFANNFVMCHSQWLNKHHPVLIQSIQESIAKQYVIYDDPNDQADFLFDGPTTHVLISGKKSFEAARSYPNKKVVVLNFANAYSPGGQPWASSAQEETLCRASTLYPCLEEASASYHLLHRKQLDRRQIDHYGNADLLFTPNVLIYKNDDPVPDLLDENDWFKVDIITSAAPELWDYESENHGYYERIMRYRIDCILSLAKAEKAEALILGAFGCGAFGNPPSVVARLFKEELKRFAFPIVEFAIFDRFPERGNRLKFEKVFAE